MENNKKSHIIIEFHSLLYLEIYSKFYPYDYRNELWDP